MFRIRFNWPIFALLLLVSLGGCGGGANQFGSQTQNNGNSSVVLAMTDTPPSTVSVLSAEVTLTGATLAPGNVSLFSGSTTVELAKLQTDVAYITTSANIPVGNYTSVTLTFANPSLTIENDTTVAIGSCAVGAICTMAPTSVSNLSATVPLKSFSIASSSTTGLLVDVDLDKLLSAALGEDFSAGTTVFPFIPAGTGAPPVGAEDVVGQVGNVSASNNTFTLTNSTASYNLKADSSSTFFQFPAGTSCKTPGFACLQNNQIVSVDIGIQSNGSIVARNILFEDADSSDAEVEGMVTTTKAASQQFNFVILGVSAPGTGLSIGSQATVQYSTTVPTPFDIDFLHVDNVQVSTASQASSFNGPADLVPGQEVSVRRNSSSGTVLMADRVRLRSSRITATAGTVGSSTVNLTNLPSLFFGQSGVTTIQALTSVTPPTIYFEAGDSINSSTNITGDTVSVRGPLFNTGTSMSRTLVATKVVLQE